jgi:hypothetical protein
MRTVCISPSSLSKNLSADAGSYTHAPNAIITNEQQC